MTETCAGAIYNTSCPNYDLEKRLEFTSLGPCMPGIEMRVVVPSEHCRLAERNEAGNLEVTGPVVFQKYFNDQTATANAFTADGWFRTGDRAIIDSAGNLNLVGRGKEVMNINGVKHAPHELESALEEALIAWAKPSYLVSFSYRPRRSQTEDICVVYVPRYPAEDVESRVQAYDTAVRTVLLQTGVRPRVVPVEESLLQKSTLGKLSRTKIKTSFECGEYNFHEETNNNVVKAYRASHITPPKNGKERLLLKEFSAALNLPDQEIGVETHLFELGVTSIDLIKMARRVEERLQLHVRIPILTMMANPTVRSLSRALERMQASRCDFDPVVVLQPRGPKTPLWLIHPGVGEVLVFLNLAKHFTDRPIFALRARGFEPGESYFRDIDEAVQTYRAAIKERQPTGPYLIAGYSYGAMLAFEVAKTLEAIGDEVPFLGCFNLPPHIKTRMRQLDWTECLVNLAYFLDLVTEDHAHALSPQIRTLGRPQAVAHVLEIAAPARVADLSLTAQALENWAGLAHGLQGMARDYEPSGSVAAVDVFYCQPLSIVAATKEEWLQDHLSKWADFCRTRPRFHAVEGSHYTIIGQTHVFGFQKVLKQALKARRL